MPFLTGSEPDTLQHHQTRILDKQTCQTRFDDLVMGNMLDFQRILVGLNDRTICTFNAWGNGPCVG